MNCRECGTDEFKDAASLPQPMRRTPLVPGYGVAIAGVILGAMFPLAILGLMANLFSFEIGGGEAADKRRRNRTDFFGTLALVSVVGPAVCGCLFLYARSRAGRAVDEGQKNERTD